MKKTNALFFVIGCLATTPLASSDPEKKSAMGKEEKEYLCEMLFHACELGIPHHVTAYVKRMESEPSLINSKNKEGKTPLMIAATATSSSFAKTFPHNRESCTKTLLEHGARGDIKDSDGNTVLHLVIMKNDKPMIKNELVRLLLRYTSFETKT